MSELVDSKPVQQPWYSKLHWQVVIALIAGTVVGLLLGSLESRGLGFAGTLSAGIGFLGDLFLRLLKMVIIPLIFTSLVSGIASLGDPRSVGRIGVRTLIFYTLTTTLAITVGLTLVNLIEPGTGIEIASNAELSEELSGSGSSLQDFLLRLVPDNVFKAMAQGEVLPVIAFAVLFGLFLIRLDTPAAKAVREVVDGALQVVQLLTLAVIRLAPVGIFALLVREVVRSGIEIFENLAPYFLTVGLGLLVHACVTLPIILLILGRRSPLEYFGKVSPAISTAFSTASSSATLPLSMECAEHGAGLRKGVTSFVLPLGATVNMDGTALYEAVAALTIAQVYGVHLSLPEQLLVLVTALLASVGAAGIPMAGLVMLVVVLEAVGLPLEGITAIIAVDRVLDMMRTATNVWSDLVGTAVISRFEGGAT